LEEEEEEEEDYDDDDDDDDDDVGDVWLECVDWMHLVQDRVQWRTLVNTVMNVRVP
jgi:hypothetical protein